MDLRSNVEQAREAFEKKLIQDDLLVELYDRYNKLEDPKLFISRAKEAFPKGCCGLASLYLQHVLGAGEVVQGHYDGEPHTFLMLGDTVVDITADQYGGPAIYVGPLIKPRSS